MGRSCTRGSRSWCWIPADRRRPPRSRWVNSRYVRIAGWGKYLPDRVLTNAEIEALVDTSDEWIRSRSGIGERRIAAPHEAASDLGLCAALEALGRANVPPSDVDLVIVATATPD